MVNAKDGSKLLITLIIFLSMVSFVHSESYDTGQERDWLLNAKNEKERLILLQNYLGGFGASMWEVGARYKHIYTALQDENFELAIYHWKKIKIAIENGYLKRPARKENADAIFLNSVYGDVLKSFEVKDIKKAWQGFSTGRSACMACHTAERIPWMNDQPMFRDTQAPL
ncbi:hypothetical protein [Microbulbifer epialgicus]|uniref:Photosynthetic reaction center cytochrome c subunit n=1 Tax=Microbulbifer epialgicus TaxID=393907 RepID=A0ABV4P1U2_9GAMM